MVNLETVFVLGAGASKDFDFPTGPELVKQICDMLQNRQGQEFDLFYEIAGQQSPDMADKFCDILMKANPLSIDAWLEHNPEYIDAGKLAIAIALLLCEQRSNLRPDSNWYQLLFQRLDSPFEDFDRNKLSIITFNYDRSLEEYLFTTFRYTHTEKSKKDCVDKLNQIRTLHVYGSLGRLDWQNVDPKHPVPQVCYGAKLDIPTVFSAASSIKIIPAKDKEPSPEFLTAMKWIHNAQALYFLGFGYNEANMTRLGIDELRRPSKVMGTAYELGYQPRREVERLSIRDLKRKYGLVPKPVYEFLHDYVDFNELGLPGI